MVTAHISQHTSCTATGGARAFGAASTRTGQSFRACIEVDLEVGRCNYVGEVSVVTILVYVCF